MRQQYKFNVNQGVQKTLNVVMVSSCKQPNPRFSHLSSFKDALLLVTINTFILRHFGGRSQEYMVRQDYSLYLYRTTFPGTISTRTILPPPPLVQLNA